MTKLVVRKSALVVGVILVIYYLLLEWYYYPFVCETYARFGFVMSLNEFKYIETKLIFIFILALSLLVCNRSGFLYAVFVFFIIFFLVPTLITYSQSDRSAVPLYAIVALLLVLGAFSFFKIRIPPIRNAVSMGVVMTFMLLFLVPIVFTFGVYFNPKNLILDDVYSTRDVFDESATTGLNYLYNWLIKAIVPVCLVFFLIHKRYFFAACAFVVLLYLYLISGNKLVYMTSFVMVFFYLFGKDYVQKTMIVALGLVAGLIVAPWIDLYFFHNDTLKGVFVMRGLFLPSNMNYYYIDFFSGSPLYFAESHFFSMFNDYPYNRPIGYIIAERYFHVTDMNANNGFIGDGFMNLGYVGIGLNVLIVSAVFLFFNSVNVDSRYLGVFFVMVFLFLSLPLLSMFVTSGLWILFLMSLAFMRADQRISERSTQP